MSLFELLFCYGLTFGMMNKTAWIQNRSHFIDSMLSCSYCTGFHAGWLSLLILHPALFSFNNIQTILFWSFVSSSFSYITDTFVAYLEDN